MDKQQCERKEIPVNARAVGNPAGMNVLYLEDYVHTFVKKIIKKDEDDRGCEIFLYGYEFDEEGRHFLIVSGAYQCESRYDRPEKIGMQYFPMSQYLGVASIHSDGISEMNMEIVKEGERNILIKNFYIYYDQNEEMQNYLIEWNLEHRAYRGNRIETEDAVRYGRIAQAYNKEEVRVSFLWNAMNVLSLGFVVCVMVYGIICINNYHKMKGMEDTLSYIVSTITENQSFVEASALFSEPDKTEMAEEAEVFQTQIVEVMSDESMEMASTEPTMSIEETTIEPEPITQTLPEEPALSEVHTKEPTAVEMTQIPQYYVVQPGDTLRSICISIYGNTDRVNEVCIKNGVSNPDNILCGQTLLLP